MRFSSSELQKEKLARQKLLRAKTEKSTVVKLFDKEFFQPKMKGAKKQETTAETHCRNLAATLPQLNRNFNLWKWSFRARLPWKTASWSCDNEVFVRDFVENLKAEVVKTTLACETSLEN